MASGGRGVSPAFGSGKSGKPHLIILIVSSQHFVSLVTDWNSLLPLTRVSFATCSSWTLLDSVYIGPVFVKPRSFELPNPDIECVSLYKKFYTWYFICCSWEQVPKNQFLCETFFFAIVNTGFMHRSETSSKLRFFCYGTLCGQFQNKTLNSHKRAVLLFWRLKGQIR